MENKLNLIIERLSNIKKIGFKNTKEILNKITHITDGVNSTNVKVHNISYYMYEAMQKGILTSEQSDELFSRLTEAEHDSFTDWEAEQVPMVKREYIGRTSSFYYVPHKWLRDVIEEDTAIDILKGKKIAMKEIYGGLDSDIYDMLFDHEFNQDRLANEILEGIHNHLEEDHSEEDFQAELDDHFMDTELLLEDIEDDLLYLLLVAKQCQEAYEYIMDYKRKENQIDVAKDWLHNYIYNVVVEEQASKHHEEMLHTLKNINKISYIKLEAKFNPMNESKYDIIVNTDFQSFSIDTEIKHGHEYSKELVEAILSEMNEYVYKQFSF